MIRRLLREPVVLYGKPYEDLSFREWSMARSLASERHHAFQWLAAGGPWGEVPTET